MVAALWCLASAAVLGGAIGSTDCVDESPSSTHTCAEQAGWGKCSQSWMVGHCCKTCFQCQDGCGATPSPTPPAPGPLPPAPSSYEPSDPMATEDTRALMSFFGQVSASPSFIFAHHNTNYQGENWEDVKCEQGQSDVIDSVGQFPGMVEYNFDKAATSGFDYTPHVQHAVASGALLQFHWEASNPLTMKNSQDLTGSPATEILPGGSANAVWQGWMDNFADFALSVGTPMVLRPFHENTGDWFWWGSSATTPAQYRAAWNYTVSYLRDTRGVHNVLYAYSPAKPADYPADESYGDGEDTRYPGDDVVDVVCFDHYDSEDFHEALLADCGLAVRFAAERGKVPAICEVGVKQGTQNLNPDTASQWFDKNFLDPIVGDEACSRIAWALTWRNSAPDSYWVPLPGQPAHEGFANFHSSSSTLFAGDFEVPYNSVAAGASATVLA